MHKRVLIILSSIFILVISELSFAYADNDNIILSGLFDNDLYTTMLELGLDIPDGCDIQENNIKMIKNHVKIIEDNPTAEYSGGMVYNGPIGLDK